MIGLELCCFESRNAKALSEVEQAAKLCMGRAELEMPVKWLGKLYLLLLQEAGEQHMVSTA